MLNGVKKFDLPKALQETDSPRKVIKENPKLLAEFPNSFLASMRNWNLFHLVLDMLALP